MLYVNIFCYAISHYEIELLRLSSEFVLVTRFATGECFARRVSNLVYGFSLSTFAVLLGRTFTQVLMSGKFALQFLYQYPAWCYFRFLLEICRFVSCLSIDKLFSNKGHIIFLDDYNILAMSFKRKQQNTDNVLDMLCLFEVLIHCNYLFNRHTCSLQL